MEHYRKDWNSIIKSDNPAQKLEHHLASFLVETKECKSLLHELIQNVKKVSIKKVRGKEYLKVDLDGKIDGETYEYVLHLGPPFEGKPLPNIPKSYLKVVEFHNQIRWECKYGSSFFGGLNKKGNYGGGGWEPEYTIESNQKENQGFLKEIEKLGYTIQQIAGPIDYGQNWIILNPTQHIPNGEPTWSFVSHGSCVVGDPLSNTLGFGPILLRLLVQFILEKDIFDEVYN